MTTFNGFDISRDRPYLAVSKVVGLRDDDLNFCQVKTANGKHRYTIHFQMHDKGATVQNFVGLCRSRVYVGSEIESKIIVAVFESPHIH